MDEDAGLPVSAFANIHLRALPDAPRLTDGLRTVRLLPAFCAQNDAWSSLFPAFTDRLDAARVEEGARGLSVFFAALVVGFHVDAKAFRYWIYSDGSLIDAYESTDAKAGGDPATLAPLCRYGVTPDVVESLLRHKRTRLQQETQEFLAEWQRHRQELRAHLLKTYPDTPRGPTEPDLITFLREFDDQTDRMSGGGGFDEPSELAADLGSLLGLPEGLARLGYGAIADGYAPIGAAVRLD